MKTPRLVLVAAVLAAACTPVRPTATLETVAPSTTAASVAAIDCGPVTDPLTCSSAVALATEFIIVPAWRIASIAIAKPDPTATCEPAALRCLRPEIIVRLVDDRGVLLQEIPLIATSGGGWVHPSQIRSAQVTGTRATSPRDIPER
jgi:hypothetical protein